MNKKKSTSLEEKIKQITESELTGLLFRLCGYQTEKIIKSRRKNEKR